MAATESLDTDNRASVEKRQECVAQANCHSNGESAAGEEQHDKTYLGS